jgi:hypothetical protein
MAHLNTGIRTINLGGDAICVDIFRRPDGSFGFDEFRRDPEDTRGWYSIGHFGDRRFDTAEAAMQDALTNVHWLADHI